MSIKTKLEILPNELLLQCFQYLNALDILHSFDRLNYRFSTLIQNIPLPINFHQFKKSSFNELYHTILSNPKNKQKINSVQLSNVDRCEHIQSNRPLFSLSEFIHFRSLSLLNLKDDNAEQVQSILPLSSDIDCFFCASLQYRTSGITPALLQSKIRILTQHYFNTNSTSIYETMSLTSLTICNCDLSDLFQLFKYISTLQYLRIGYFSDSQITDDELNFINTNTVYLNQLIIDYSLTKFKVFELLLKSMPNLKIFSISAPDKM